MVSRLCPFNKDTKFVCQYIVEVLTSRPADRSVSFSGALSGLVARESSRRYRGEFNIFSPLKQQSPEIFSL
jgi:hypothetical protein